MLIAWRAWRVKSQRVAATHPKYVRLTEPQRAFLPRKEEYYLQSTVLNHVTWATSTMEAQCMRSAVTLDVNNHHEAPNKNCQCGLYAALTVDRAAYFLRGDFGVIGQVGLWGTVIPHHYGYRAQYMQILSFYTTARGILLSRRDENYPILRELSKKYNVPLEPVEEKAHDDPF